jgi:Na+-driven multidrug efflux pump
MLMLSPFIPKLWVEVSPSQQLLATQMIIVYGIFLSVYSVCVSAYQILRAGGKTTQTMLMDSGLMWAGTVPLAWALALFTNLPLVLMFMILQTIDIIKMMLGLYLVKRGHWANNLTTEVTTPSIMSPLNDLLK